MSIRHPESERSARLSPATCVALRVLAIAAILGLTYVSWLPFPWRMPVVGLIGVALVWLETRSRFSSGLAKHGTLATFGWTLALFGVVVGVVGPILEPLINHLLQRSTDYSAYGALRDNRDATLHLIGLAWLSAAIGEELVFRAFLLHHLSALLSRFRAGQVVACLLGGAVFGGMHAAQGASGIILTGVVGTLFGLAYLRSGRNLLAMMLAHGLIDTWGVFTLYKGWY